MKSHPAFREFHALYLLCAVFILPLLLLVVADPLHFAAANSSATQLDSLALTDRSSRTRKVDRFVTPGALRSTHDYSANGPHELRARSDGSGPLPADATLTWNTFLGGFAIPEEAVALAFDGSGNVYVAGTSNATWGLPINAHSGDDDAFVAKLDANGKLIWSTFLGGNRSDLASALAVDGSGDIYLAGYSTGAWGSPVRAFSGGYDAFAAKLDSSGHLIWNTFLGGPGTTSGLDYGRALALDTAGNVYVGGESGAPWGSPVQPPVFPTGAAFIAKLDSSGTLIWHTFVGAGNTGFGIALDQSGSIYLTGGGGSWGSPIRAFSGNQDAYVAKVDSGGHLIWNTFLGGSDYDFGYAVALDLSGNVYVAGYSTTTWGLPIRAYSGTGDAFAARLDPTGKLIWNTFLGGNSFDFGFALAVDAVANVYVAGSSAATWGSPIRPFGGGSDDAFVARLGSSGNLVWNMFLGGSLYDDAHAVAADGKGNIYVAGASDATWGSPVRAYTSGGDGFVARIADTDPSQVMQFDSATYTVNEGSPRVNITISRSGDTTGSASVSFATNDTAGLQTCNVVNHIASQRCDYLNSAGTLTFAPGETTKSFPVAIIDDSYAEGDETFAISLSNASVALGVPFTATVTIIDKDLPNDPNPIDTASFFVRLHYLDFLNREPDQAGWDFWTSTITSCGSSQPCIDLMRINASGAFFLSVEFQETGYLVYRTYKAAYGNMPNAPVPVKLNEFLPDTQEIDRGVVVNQTGWEQVLENNKRAFTSEFVQRLQFISAFPTSNSPAQFVGKLFANAGVAPTTSERDAAIAEFGSASTTADVAARARALRDVAENSTLKSQEFNRAFVLMQYFGYLRRNPNDAPELDFSGYDFWLTKLNQFNGNFVNAEMVKAFITSGEYRQRFGP